jgi:transposase
MIKLFRRNGVIPLYTSVYFDHSNEIIYIYTDEGRVTRPIFYVENRKIGLNQEKIKDLIESTGNKLLYSVPYNPTTNAIEEFFSQLKHYIKKESPNTYNDIDKVIKDTILTKIKKEHLKNYLKHSFKIYK